MENKTIPDEHKKCGICAHENENATTGKHCASCALGNKFEPDYMKICKWCWNKVAPGSNICESHRKSHAAHSWPGCLESDVAKQELKVRRERIATALMPQVYAGYIAYAEKNGYQENWKEGVAKEALEQTDALIKALDEVKE